MPSRLSALITAIALAIVLVSDVSPAQNTPRAFLRRPDIHGDTVVFTSEGDLWLGELRDRTARRITAHPGLETAAHFSPDGTKLAFTAQYDGGTDVYVMDVAGGEPKRLTYDWSSPIVLGWTPDGKSILFRSRRGSGEMHNRLYTIPAAGGIPTALPIPRGEFGSINADGHRVAYVPVSAEWQHWFHYQGGQADDIWLADTASHAFRKLTDYPGVDTTPVWVGSTLYFVSERYGLANLCRLDPASRKVSEVTHYSDYEARYPATDGKRVVFEHGDGLALYDPASNKTFELAFAMTTDRIHARERRVPMQPWLDTASLGPTGKRVAVEARGQILSLASESGDARLVAPLPGSRSQYPAWSPDGKQMAFVSDRSGEEQIWVAPVNGPATTQPRQVTRDHKGPLGPVIWSPDDRWMAVGDHKQRIYLVDAASGAMTEVDHSDASFEYDDTNFSYRFSPDGKWLTFVHPEANFFHTVILYDIANRKRIAVTNAVMNSGAPVFTPDGKFLVFLQDREFNPRPSGPTRFFGFDKTTRVTMLALADKTPSPFLPEDDEEGKPAPPKPETPKPAAGHEEKPALPDVKVDLDGLQARTIDVPLAGGDYGKVEPIEGKLLVLENAPPTIEGAGPASNTLISFDIKKKQPTTIASHISDFDVSNDGKKLLLIADKDLSVVDATTGPVAAGTGKVSMAGITLDVKPEQEWKQIFEESWRLARDFFYDPNMQGVDWPAVRRKYEAQLPAVASRSDLNTILGNMIAELNVGHAYVGGGDTGVTVPQQPIGYLGADLEPVAIGGANAYRIVKLFPGDEFDYDARSPLLAPGVDVKEGEYILAVGGEPVRADQDIEALLIGRAGLLTSIMVNSKPTLDGAREVRIKPLPFAQERQARYYDWVASRREYVRTHGGPNLGYLHIPDMGAGGLEEFTKHYYPNLQKDGMIYDVRNNGGGFISGMLLLQMSSKPYSWFKFRDSGSWPRADWAFAGYSAALCNEGSGSNAEEFSDAFQRLKLGPLIGVRTWGGLVGSGGGYSLIDNGKLYIPNYGAWSPDRKWIVEGVGAVPDIVVEQDPADVMAGKDPQLDRAIAYLKDRIAKDPVPRPQPPPYPVKVRK